MAVNLSQCILKELFDARPQPAPVAQLQAATGLAAPALAAEIAELRQLGYDIELHPHFGYRLLATPDRLMADDLQARLGPTVIGSRIQVFQQTGSTNDVVIRQGLDGAAEGLAVYAESQTAGRGRQGRSWKSPAGKGLWFSILLRPPYGRGAAGRITVAASVAVAETLRQAAQVDARIKWPNDIMINGKKIAGILTEWQQPTGKPPFAVLGIGIDVNCRHQDLPAELQPIATSLLLETGTAQDRPALAAAILSKLDSLYRQSASAFDDVIARWADLNSMLGRHLSLRVGSQTVVGFAQALDSDGALLIRRDNGQIDRILSGDVIEQLPT